MANVKIRRKTGSSTYDVVYPAADWSNIDNKPATFTPTSHTHGDITNGGAITSTVVTPASGDNIIVSDSSASDVLKRGITIGTSTSTFLRNDGTWATPAGVDTNNYLTGVSGSGNGTVTFTRQGLSNLTWDASHNHSIGYYNSAISSNLDTLFSTGEFGFANTTTGRPEDYGQGINIVNSGTAHNGTNNWITQLAFGTAGSTSYFRTKVNTGAWTAWRKIWNEANDGTGSGLDADLLDGQHGSYFLDTSGSAQTKSGNLTVSATMTAGTATARMFTQSANGVPTSNLGTPTVSEMALFDEQFDNKTAFASITRLSAETSSDGSTWTSFALTDAQKRGLLGGDYGTAINIPYNTTYFRFKLLPGDYVYANALYCYWSSQGHTTAVQIYKKHDSGSYTQHTNSTNQVSAWPGHLYLPFSTIPWLDNGTLGTHFDEVYVVFIPTWNATYSANSIQINKLQIWGGYPAGKRNVYTTDDSKNVAFPAGLTGTRLFSTIANGTSPLSVTSTTVNTNLNADLLDGYHETSFIRLAANSGSATNGNFAIGNASSRNFIQTHSGQPLDINPLGNSVAFDTNTLFVDATNNRVGVGTSSPSYTFHVKTTDTSTTIGANIVGRFETNASNADASLQLSDGVSSASQISHTAGALHLRTANTTRLSVLSDGNVGIGTTAPAVKLHVVGGTRITGQLNVMGDAETKRVWVDFEDGNDMGTIQVVQDGVAYKNLALQPDGNNVGIGTRSPSEKLEVNGVAKATSFTSTVATGTAPISVTSTTVATNLNADLLDGQHGSAYQLVSGMGSYALSNHTHGNISNGGGWQSSPATIANGDSLVITQSGLLRNTNLSFNTNTDAFLAQNGTWVKPIYTSYKSTQQTNDTTTAATYHSITLPHSGYYSITVYGMWSKTTTTNLVGNVISVITSDNTGTPKFDGAFEWQQTTTASAFTTENNSINIPTSGTSLGITTQTATQSRTETYWSMKGFLYTGTTSDKTLSFQFACSTAPGTGSVALEKIAIVATKVG